MLCIYTPNCFLAWSVFVWYAIKIDIRPRPVSIFGDHSATHFLPRFLSFRFVGNTWIQRLTCSNHYPRVSHRTFGSRTQSISFERKSFIQFGHWTKEWEVANNFEADKIECSIFELNRSKDFNQVQLTVDWIRWKFISILFGVITSDFHGFPGSCLISILYLVVLSIGMNKICPSFGTGDIVLDFPGVIWNSLYSIPLWT